MFKSIIKRQFDQFKNNRVVFIKLKSKILFMHCFSIPFYILYIPIIIFIILISPVWLIRIGKIPSNRIGHLAGNIELHILEKTLRKHLFNGFNSNIYFPGYYPICNKFLLNKWAKHLTILPKSLLNPLYNWLSLVSRKHVLDFPNRDRDIHNLLDKTEPTIEFDCDEILTGDHFINHVNPTNKKIVCVIIRDDAYLKDHLPLANMSYHDFRNYKLDNYLPAIKKLIQLKYFVIRMGSKAKNRIPFEDSNFLDYPFSGYRSEFLDIFIAYRCHFVISTSTGWDAVPGVMFRKPMLICPMMPIANFWTFSSKFMLTTANLCKSSNRKLTLTEIFELNLENVFDIEEYDVIIENSSQEILDAVIDMVNYIEVGNLNLNSNKIFWTVFEKHIRDKNLRNLHGEMRAIMSPSFLESNKHLLK